MKDVQSKTQDNLRTAFLRESGAFMDYTFYAEQAKADGYEQIAKVFTQFATNEQAHAKVWFQLFHGIAGTEDNLIDSIDLENHERTVMYLEFSKVARQEGFNDIADLFDGVADIEKEHEKVYKTLLENVQNNKVFKNEKEVIWQCQNCGHEHKGKNAPQKCPICSSAQAFFSIKQQN